LWKSLPSKERKRTITVEKKNILGRTAAEFMLITPKTMARIKKRGASFNITGDLFV
jgi:hypothetical protein